MEAQLKLILQNVQENASCHQKYLKSLENCYAKVQFEIFLDAFLKYLKHLFHWDIEVQNLYIERTLEFFAKFISVLTKPQPDDDEDLDDEDTPSHPFLTAVIIETLKFHDLIHEQARYYSCRLITLILQNISNDTHLDNSILDCIQEAMLERLMDPKTLIRVQAITALVRLQEPANPDCPVIKAYIPLLSDANASIRKEVVKIIAPNAATIVKICERIQDVNVQVRVAAFTRCADIGPQLFKIVLRQRILQCGFKDTNAQVKAVFMDKLLPKWLSFYNNDFVAFLGCIKLDADEKDIIDTEEIAKQVMTVVFKTAAIKDVIGALVIDSEKLIPLGSLSSEIVLYWNIVTTFLRNSDECEEYEGYLDTILPELTPFCHFIQRVIDYKNSKHMEEWEYLDYQYILYNLFDIAEHLDISEEVGRRALSRLVMSVLQKYKLQFKVIQKVMGIADRLITNVDLLTNEICQIISDIREPLVEQAVTERKEENRDFQMAELKVKLNILQGEIEDALDAQDFQKAAAIQTEIAEYKKKLESFVKPVQVVKVRVSKDDPETVCQCLDILIALLQLQSVTALTPSLATCKTEFLLPLLTSSNVEIHWRVLKCITLYCLFDQDVLKEHARILCFPIVTYRTIPNYNKFALIRSVGAVCDLMRYYNSDVFGGQDDAATSVQLNATRRKLYRNDMADDVPTLDYSRMNVEIIIDIIVDMLDDENEDIRETAAIAIIKLMLNEFPVNSSLISRIILKWFNPSEKAVDSIQQKLGLLINNFAVSVKGARQVIEKSVVPIITSLAEAPRTSPLADVDIDNVLKFLAAITDSADTRGIVVCHTNLAHTLCYKIASKPEDAAVPYFSKMLLYLEIPAESILVVKELVGQAEQLLKESDIGVTTRKHVAKFVDKLKCILNNSTREQSLRSTLPEELSSLSLNDNTGRLSAISEEAQQASMNHLDTTGLNVQSRPAKRHKAHSNESDNDMSQVIENDDSSTDSSEKRQSKRLKVQSNRSSTSSDTNEIVSDSSMENDRVQMSKQKVDSNARSATKKVNNKSSTNKADQAACVRTRRNGVNLMAGKENENLPLKRTRRGASKKSADSQTNVKKLYRNSTDTSNKNSAVEVDSGKKLRKSKRQKIFHHDHNAKENGLPVGDIETPSRNLRSRAHREEATRRSSSSSAVQESSSDSSQSRKSTSPSEGSSDSSVRRSMRNDKKMK